MFKTTSLEFVSCPHAIAQSLLHSEGNCLRVNSTSIYFWGAGFEFWAAAYIRPLAAAEIFVKTNENYRQDFFPLLGNSSDPGYCY